MYFQLEKDQYLLLEVYILGRVKIETSYKSAVITWKKLSALTDNYNALRTRKSCGW